MPLITVEGKLLSHQKPEIDQIPVKVIFGRRVPCILPKKRMM